MTSQIESLIARIRTPKAKPEREVWWLTDAQIDVILARPEPLDDRKNRCG